ncbi:uncharacterized protein B0I36DRAFT_208297, partial [Microdochium trichocladiopsis]
LLRYDERHSVLICRQCQYAIQKTAIESHLLRHKIYRSERRQAMAAVAQLEILDPEHVQLPPPTSSPVFGLPLLPGLKCVMPGCAMLCVSAKRMKRHWAEVHNTTNYPTPFATDVQMQTFFRGTKNRYFEVNAAMGDSGDALSSGPPHLRDPVLPLSAAARPASTTATPLAVDINVLQYFHHYTSCTSQTLPLTEEVSRSYWQTHAVQVALQHQPLMAGLLALAATHLALSTSHEEIKKPHVESAYAFERQFLAGTEVFHHDANTPPPADAVTSLHSQVSGILGLMRWGHAASQQHSGPEGQVLDAFQSFHHLIQRCAFSFTPSQHREEAAGQDEIPHAAERRVPSPPPAILRVHKLPYQMTTAFGRPKDPGGVISVLTVLNSLSERLALCHLSRGPTVAWTALVGWLDKLPEQFRSLVERKEAPVLVALAFGAVLIKHAARSYWFLEGCAERWFDCIVADLPKD